MQSGKEERDEDGVRVLSCSKLVDMIKEIYASKSKFDKKCCEGRLPRETMEQHLYTFLYQKYGLRSLMIDWASAIIKGVKYYSDVDIHVNCFGKILRNELNEDFRFVLSELEREAGGLLLEYFKAKYPLKPDASHAKMAAKRKGGIVQEEEWVDIVKHLYEDDDALNVISKVLEFARQLTAEEEDEEEAPQDPGQTSSVFAKNRRRIDIYYEDFIKVVQGCQMEAQERYLSKFFQLFRRFDSDHNGMLNEQEFRQLMLALGSKTEAQVQKCVRAVDPHGHQMISFSECVVALGEEIARMR